MDYRHQYFEDTYEKYHQMVYNICYSYLRCHFDAEDILQESFLDLFKSKKVFESNDHEKHYLIRIVINNCKTHLKKQKRTILLTDEQLYILKSEDNINDINIIDIISILPHKYKEVVILRYVENLSYKDISIILNINEANARKRLERALKMLKKEWEE